MRSKHISEPCLHFLYPPISEMNTAFLKHLRISRNDDFRGQQYLHRILQCRGQSFYDIFVMQLKGPLFQFTKITQSSKTVKNLIILKMKLKIL